jgi:cysteine-rich repeat protein
VQCNVGAAGCGCTVGGGCDAGLACDGGVCMPEATSTSMAPTSSSDGSSSEESSSSSSSTSDTTGIPKGCGDDELEAPEECDDGNNESGDGCNADCTLGGQLVWAVTFDGPYAINDLGHRVAVDADDNVLVAGTAFAPEQDRDGIVIKLDDDGQIEWDEAYDSEVGNSNDGFWGVAASPDGEVIVTGHTDAGADSSDALIRCYSADGDVLWTHVENTPTDGYAFDVAVDPDDNVIVLGLQRDAMDGSWQTRVWKLTIDGDIIWDETYENGIYPNAYAMVVDSAGSILYGAGDGSAFVRKLSSDAEEEWFWESEPAGLRIEGLAIDPFDDVLVGGSIGNNPLHSRVARHAGPNGALEWDDEWMGELGGFSTTRGIASDTGGRPVTVGSYGDGGMTIAAFVRKQDMDETVWVYESISKDSAYDALEGVAVDSTGHVIASGTQRQDNGYDDIWIIKLTP